MPNIRIKDIPTTASATSSTDFIGIDGSANGTRKLNAFSPTFGGNLTVSGTASVTGQINGSAGYQFRAASGTTYELLRYVGGTNNPGIFTTVNESTKKVTIFASGSLVSGQTLGLGAEGSEALTLGAANATLSGNLTVSGGTITGGASGMSLASGGTNQNLSITPSGTGRVHIAKSAGQDSYIELAGNGNTAGTSSVVIGQSGADLGVLYNRKNAALSFGTNGTEVARFFANGNLFVGASPVDGGQKLQVSGTGYFSGDLTVGAKTGAQSTPDKLQMSSGYPNTSTPTNQQLKISLGYVSATQNYGFTTDNIARIWYHAGDTVGPTGGHVFATGGIAALTLDSSQNATFAGNATITKCLSAGSAALTSTRFGVYFGGTLSGSTDQLGIVSAPTFDSSATGLAVSGYFAPATANSSFTASNVYGLYVASTVKGAASTITTNYGLRIFDQTAGTTNYAIYTGSGLVRLGGDTTVVGSIAIGNTVNTVSPTSPNRTITMVIGGTTYYIHAKTTND